MNKQFPSFSSVEQTQKINELLGACESYYTVSDLFQYLPNEIEYRGQTGYLTIDNYDLSWVSYDGGTNSLNIAHTIPMPIGLDTNIFDVFIQAIEFVQKYNLNQDE